MSLNQSKMLVLLLALIIGLSMAFFGTLAGEPIYYTIGSYILLALIAYSFLTNFSGKKLLLLVIVIHLFLRYVPIMKFNQPLYVDATYELATATEFEKNGRINILPGIIIHMDSLKYQSGWPLVHLLTLIIHEITGLSLFHIFTYFAPLVDLSSLLSMYLLANYIFKSNKIGALSALIFATFYGSIFWNGTQLVRQTIAYPLALMAIYLYIKGRTERKAKIMAFSFFTFGILPMAHHLSSLEIFYIFLFWLFLELFLVLWEKVNVTIFHRLTLGTSMSHSYTLPLCLFMGVSLFLWWVTYAKEIILDLFLARAYTLLFGIVNLTFWRGGLSETVVESGGVFYMSTGLYNVLSYIKVLFLAVITLYGIFVLAKGKDWHRSLLYASLLAPLSLFFAGWLIDRTVTDVRHLAFLLIPVSVITAATMRKFERKILALCLLIVIVPAPFQLFVNPGEPTPTFIYDKSGTGNILPIRDVIYREDTVLAVASYFASHADSNLIADTYVTAGLVFHYDPYKLLPTHNLLGFLSNPKLISQYDSIVLVHGSYFNTKYLMHPRTLTFYEKYNFTLPYEELEDYANRLNSIGNSIYNNGDVIGWKSPR